MINLAPCGPITMDPSAYILLLDLEGIQFAYSKLSDDEVGNSAPSGPIKSAPSAYSRSDLGEVASILLLSVDRLWVVIIALPKPVMRASLSDCLGSFGFVMSGALVTLCWSEVVLCVATTRSSSAYSLSLYESRTSSW